MEFSKGMKTVRIGFICTEMLPSPAIRGGAIQILIDGVAPYIAKGNDLTVFSITDPELPLNEKTKGIEYVRFPKKDYVNSIAEYLRNAKPFDVIHVFNRPRFVYTYKQATPSSSFVLSLHNEMFHPKKISDEEALKCIENVDAIMTVSNYIGRTVMNRFPMVRPKLRTVYSGADLNSYTPIWEAKEKRRALREKHGLTGKKVVLFVGRLSEKKGPHILIEAFKQVVSKHRDAVLIIAGGRWFGDNTVDKYVKQLYSLCEPIKENVIFTKFVSPTEMPDYYLMSDIFVCASQWQEPLARVHYEAMAAGLPVITTDRGGNAEIIRHRHNGIVIKNFSNPKDFADAICTLLSDAGLALKFGRRGWNVAEKYCNFSRVANDLLRVYKRCAYRFRRR